MLLSPLPAFLSFRAPVLPPSTLPTFLPSTLAELLPLVLRVPNRMRRIGGPRTLVDANGSEAARLEHAHQLQSDHLEQREKGDDQAAAVVDVREQLVEAARLGLGEPRQQLLDSDLDGNLLRRQHDSRSLPEPLQHRLT